MGIAPYKYFTYDGESSRDYDVYITGEGVFNAPERAVEMYEIPGRNGSYALDQGKFNNISVTYKAGIVDYSESDFADKVSAVRNWLCSKVGYKRLSDDYNPNEYRMAVYKSGVNIEHEDLRTGTFEITFDCKPQRWLTSGEEAVTIGEWGETETVSGDIVEVEATETDAVKSLVADIVPIQSGSGTPSPDNIRPISGTNSMSVYRSGKNICVFDATSTSKNGLTFTVNNDGSVKVTGTASAGTSFYTYVGANNSFYVANGTYKVSGCPSGGSSSTYRFYVDNRSASGTSSINSVADSGIGNTITITQNRARAYIYISNGYAIPTGGITFYPMLLPSTETDTSFEKYQGNTYTTALGTTVYGGTLDLVSGELTVTHKLVDLGDYTWVFNNQSGHYYYLFSVADNDIKAPPDNNTNANAICSAYEVDTYTHVYNNTTNGTFAIGTGKRLAIYDTYAISQSMTAAQFKTYVAGQKVCYELATPTTTTLTPQQVELLIGTNNIWADSGDVTVEYGHNPMVLVNPTPFEAEPLLAVDGYGTIGFNGYEVEIDNEPLGVITLVGEEKYTSPIQLDLSNVNTGDDIILQLERTRFSVTLDGLTSKTSNYVFDPCVDSNSDFSSAYLMITGPTVTSYTRNIVYQTNIAEPLTFKKGTSKTITNTVTSSFQCKYNGTTYTVSFSVTESIAYNGTTHEITMTTVGTVTTTLTGTQSVTQVFYNITSIIADSTKSAVSDSIFIDCEVGECWTIQGGNIISLNGLITLGSDLPKLSSGTNTFNYDNTVTNLEVTPRWWKV